MVKTSFRIIPVRPDIFHVQEKRRFLPGWKTVTRPLAAWFADCDVPREFKTQEDATLWVNNEIARRTREARHLNTAPVILKFGA